LSGNHYLQFKLCYVFQEPILTMNACMNHVSGIELN
jgi:hypothetical protein